MFVKRGSTVVQRWHYKIDIKPGGQVQSNNLVLLYSLAIKRYFFTKCSAMLYYVTRTQLKALFIGIRLTALFGWLRLIIYSHLSPVETEKGSQ